MTEIRFYHLKYKPLEEALPEILAKTYERGWRAVIMTSSPERAEALTQLLWTYQPHAFLPHGNERDGNATEQPIWLTDKDENPNKASALFLVDGALSAQVDSFDLVCEIFSEEDPEAVAAARQRWKQYAQAEHKLTYWQQTENGWSKQA